MFSVLYAGETRSVPHLFIQGHAKPEARRHVSTRERRTLHVVVFIRVGHPNIVVPLPSAEQAANWDPNDPATALSGTSTALTAALYEKIVEAKLVGSGSHMADGRRSSSRHGLKLVEDKSSVHTSGRHKAFLSGKGIEQVLLPAKSPDLSPLDNGFFGTVNTEWRKRVTAGRLGWDGMVAALLEVLQQTPADGYIKALPRHIRNCMKARGWYF